MPYVFFGIICLVFGSNFYLMSLASSYYGPLAVGAGRLLGGAAMLVLLWGLSARRESLTRRQFVAASLIGFVGHSYPYAMQPALIANGLEHSFIATMVSFTPMSIMLLSVPVLGVWPTTRQVVGVVGGLAFLSLLMVDGSFRGYSLGVLSLAISVPLSYGLANAYLRKTLHDAPPLAVTLVMLGSSGLLLAPLAAAAPLLQPLGLAPPSGEGAAGVATAAMLMLGPIGTGLMMWLWVRLVATQGPLFAGMVTYVVPVVAMMWGLFDGERVTTNQLVAIAGVLGMVALVQYGAASKPSGEPAPGTPSDPEPTPECPHPPCDRELACAGASR
ncbi:DMT family transporter [Posidoniimonas corsicana]|nr:DMT family transporter [Posidoniimonas corsicana]